MNMDYTDGYEDARLGNLKTIVLGLFLGHISAFCLAYSWGWFS